MTTPHMWTEKWEIAKERTTLHRFFKDLSLLGMSGQTRTENIAISSGWKKLLLPIEEELAVVLVESAGRVEAHGLFGFGVLLELLNYIRFAKI